MERVCFLMRIKRKDANVVKLHENSQVKVKTAGATTVVQFCEGQNKKCPVQNLSKDTYMLKETGEITLEETKTIAATGNHEPESIVTKKETCGSDGEGILQCKRCKNIITTYIIPKTNKHKYIVLEQKNAGCIENGYKVEKCTVCGDVNESVLPCTGRHYGEAGSSQLVKTDDFMYHRNKCKNCRDFFDEPHVFAYEPNYDGSHTRTCICGKTEQLICERGNNSICKDCKATVKHFCDGNFKYTEIDNCIANQHVRLCGVKNCPGTLEDHTWQEDEDWEPVVTDILSLALSIVECKITCKYCGALYQLPADKLANAYYEENNKLNGEPEKVIEIWKLSMLPKILAKSKSDGGTKVKEPEVKEPEVKKPETTSGGAGSEGGKYSILSYEDAENITFDAIHGPNNADAVVLGKYGDGGPTAYTSVAKDMDAQYFQLDNWNELAARYSDDEIWKINEKFLDIQTSSGREIYLSHNPEDYLGKGQFYSRELQYLLDNGYKFVDEGGMWHAVR